MLRDHDHGRTRAFLGRLERDGLKDLQNPTPDLYGSLPFGASAGWGGWSGSLLGAHQAGAKRDYAAQAGPLWTNSAVAIGLSWFADNLPEPKPRIARRKSDGSIDYRTDLPAVRAIRRPNRFYRWATLVTACNLSYRVDGNAFVLITKNPFFRKGDPVELYWIDHRKIQPMTDPDGTPYWRRWTGKGYVRHDLDEVIHVRDGIDPDNPRLGCSALKRCIREVCTDNEAATYHEAVLRQMGVVGVVIQPGDVRAEFGSPEEREEIADTFVEKTTGTKRGRPIVTDAAWKLDQLGVKPDEMALDQILKIPESRICGALRLPAMVLGLAVGAEQRTFSNYGEARKAAYEDAVIPFLKLLAEAFTDDLLPLLDGIEGDEVDFDYAGVQCLGESEDSRFKRFGEAYQTHKVITKNQALAGVGLETVPTGDVYADGTTPEPTTGDNPDAPGATTPAAGAAVQESALNGAQIQWLAQVVAQVAAGQIPRESGRGILAAAFPTLNDAKIEAILGPLDGFKPTPPPAAAEPPPAEPTAADDTADDVAAKSLLVEATGLLKQLGIRP